jgi:phi13 family phage major tail protein
MPEEKIVYGLSNVHYAPYTITNGIITFDTPIPIPGAVEMTNDPVGDPIEFYADNMVYYYADNNQGYEGTLNIARLPDSFKQDILGEVLDETDQVMIEYADVQTKPFALLFQFENDVKAKRHLMFNCNARRTSLSSSTKTQSTEPGTTTLSYKATPIIINKRPIVKVSTMFNTPDTIYNGWFQSVWMPTTDPTGGGEV